MIRSIMCFETQRKFCTCTWSNFCLSQPCMYNSIRWWRYVNFSTTAFQPKHCTHVWLNENIASVLYYTARRGGSGPCRERRKPLKTVYDSLPWVNCFKKSICMQKMQKFSCWTCNCHNKINFYTVMMRIIITITIWLWHCVSMIQ